MSLIRSEWEETETSPFNIDLDPENSRIDPLHRNSQLTMLAYMAEQRGIIRLAERINEYNGMYPHERIICIPFGKRYIVVEGNRRVAACQALLKPHIITKTELYDRLPEISPETRENIGKIPIIVAANREIADKVVASIHLTDSKLRWSDIGQMRHVQSRYQHGRPASDLARDLKVPVSRIEELLFLARAYDRATGLGWTPKERDFLYDYDLDIEPFKKLITSQLIVKLGSVSL